MQNNLINDAHFEEILDRKNLAVIARINSLTPIKGKDFIEFAKIEGWTAVVRKGDFAVNDLVLICRYDSILPEISIFEFMRSLKFKVKTKKFTTDDGPIYSQVIVVSLSTVKNYLQEFNNNLVFNEGDDLTDALGIKKYIPNNKNVSSSFGKMSQKSTFPTFLVSKTDEANGCSKAKLLDELSNKPYFISVKYDGSSLTALIKDGQFCICSRNFILKEEDNAFWQAALKYNLKQILENNPNIIIQGELCGPKIQGNKIGLTELDLYIFNIISSKTRQILSLKEMQDFCNKYNLKFVSVIDSGNNFNYSIDRLIEMSSTLKYPNGGKAEGIVVRPQEHTFSNCLKDRLSFKVINPEY